MTPSFSWKLISNSSNYIAFGTVRYIADLNGLARCIGLLRCVVSCIFHNLSDHRCLCSRNSARIRDGISSEGGFKSSLWWSELHNGFLYRLVLRQRNACLTYQYCARFGHTRCTFYAIPQYQAL